MDVGPTLLDLADAEPLPMVSGRSFADLALTSRQKNPSQSNQDAIICEKHNGRMIRSGPWKYSFYLNGPEELYNLDDDPDELTNRAGSADERLRCDEFRSRVMAGWDTTRTQQVLERRSAELPFIQQWIRTVTPAEPIEPWFDGKQENEIFSE
jgi:arylsulfatase A-like enzyme